MKRLAAPTATALAMLAALAAAPVSADPVMGLGPRRGPLFLRQLFLPAQVMQHQSAIGLTEAQRETITKEMAATHKQALELRWQLEAKSTAVDELLAAERVDEAAAMARVAELMRLEEEMKRTHLRLLIRVKNVLTAEQQAKLRDLAPPRLRRLRGAVPNDEPPPDVP